MISTRIRKTLANRVAHHGTSDLASRTIVSRAAARYGCKISYGASTIEISRQDDVIVISSKDMVHAPHIARDFDIFFSAVTPDVSSTKKIVDYSAPRIHHYRDLDVDLLIPSMQEAIDVASVYCPHAAPAEGDLVFDLGANIGVVSIWLARKVGLTGKVVSFEPDPKNFQCLEHNIAASGSANIEPVAIALSDSTGTASFYSEGSIGSGFQNLRADSMLPTTSGEKISVATLSLEDAINKYGKPAWMKIDIEGAELEMLQSSIDVLKDAMPHLAIETDHLRGTETTAERVETLLKSIGYSVTTGRVGGTQMTWTLPR